MKNFNNRIHQFRKILMLAILCSIFSLSHNLTSAQNIDSKGTEFWLMFPENFDLNLNIELFITSDVSTTGTVEIPGLLFSEDFVVTANEITTVALPVGVVAQGTDVTENKGIHITSLEEVTVYGLNQREFSTDAYLGLPTDAVGTSYYVMSYENSNLTFLNSSQFGIVATEDNTEITITPTSSVGLKPANVAYTVMLDEGETYQGRTSGTFSDLTGTLIVSDKPVGVFGSNTCANVPLNVGFCDHLIEMLPPAAAWGTNFVTVPFANRVGGDTFRFLASEDDTDIFINGVLTTTIDAGDFFETILSSSSQINSSNPILVAQFMHGNDFDGNTFPGDPAMMILPPFEQFLGEYTLSTPEFGFVDNYLNVVVDDAGIGLVILDGVAIPAASFSAIGTSGFSGAQIEIDLGSHTLNSTVPFGVFSYGVNDDDSYAYPGGQLFAEVATVSILELNPETDTKSTFTQQCLEASLTTSGGAPVQGVRIDFEVSGVNTLSGFAFTNSSGVATFCYTSEDAGEDQVLALQGSLTDESTITWIPAILDCNGDPNGTAYIDECDVCVGGNTGLVDCQGVVPGCTDPDALNYNPDANEDDGSCIYPEPVLGCTDPLALNYNPDATEDDDSCQYSQETGCYGYEVLEYVQGTKLNGSNLDADRIDPAKALGEPDRVNAVGGFVSLGYGGSISLSFNGQVSDQPGDDILVWETSYASDDCLSDGIEAAQIELSQDGILWVPAGTLCRDGGVDIAVTGLPWVSYIKIINDASSTTFDGYDVDGVEAINGCGPDLVDECFGTEVLAYNPGPKDDGNPITDPQRLDPNKALGAPQLDDTFNFVSLGYGGEIIVGFDGVALNGPGPDILVVETTFGNQDFLSYPESADVYVTQDGTNYFLVGSLNTSQVGLFEIDDAGQGFAYITAVKVVDTTPLGSVSEDGFDVDAIEALNGCGSIPEDPPGQCYAAEMVEYVQGTTSGGGAIALNRTDPTQALGEPEGTDQLVFVALGYDGSLTLGFNGSVPNEPGPDLEIVETTYNFSTCANYPEYADVYVSQDGIDFFFAKTVCRDDNLVDIDDAGQGFTFIEYVKIVNNNLLTTSPDGFDVDGVRAIHNCVDEDNDNEETALLKEESEVASISSQPNPTTGPAVVVFNVPSTVHTTVEVFDMNGRNVISLFNQEAIADQEYRLDFEGSFLTNGIYIYRLTYGAEVVTEKFIIAR